MTNYLQTSLCIDCGEGITNPICHECLQKELRYALADCSNCSWKTRKEALKSMNSTSQTLSNLPETSVNCLNCGENVTICAHCFSKRMRNILSRLKLNQLTESAVFYPEEFV